MLCYFHCVTGKDEFDIRGMNTIFPAKVKTVMLKAKLEFGINREKVAVKMALTFPHLRPIMWCPDFQCFILWVAGSIRPLKTYKIYV